MKVFLLSVSLVFIYWIEYVTSQTSPEGSNCSTNSVSIPLVWAHYGYLFNITVGTPPQTIEVLSDWTWISLFTRSGRCENTYDPALCDAQGQQFFTERASSTFQNTTLPQITWPQTVYSPDFTVDYVKDTVCLNTTCTAESQFQLADFPFNGTTVPKLDFGGIYGLAPVTHGLNQSYYTQAYQAWKVGNIGGQVGWNGCSTLPSNGPCLGGDAKYVFGGTDTSLYDTEEMTFFPVQDQPWLNAVYFTYDPPINNYWATGWTGGWIQGQNISIIFWEPPPSTADNNIVPGNPPTIVLDEGSEGLGAPLTLKSYYQLSNLTEGVLADNSTVAAITQQYTSGPNTASQPWYTVDCNCSSSFPDFIYEFDGRKNFTIGPRDYVEMIQDGSGRCYLNVNVWPTGRRADGGADMIVMGLALLKRLYVVLDFEGLRFGLAPLKGATS